MTALPMPTPPPPMSPTRMSGVTGVTRLTDARNAAPHSSPDLAPTQGTLALDLDSAIHRREVPELRIVSGGPGPVRLWVARFAQSLVEVVAGDRIPSQLVRCTTDRVYAQVLERAGVVASVGRPHQRRRRVRAQVRSVHLFQPEPTVAEVSVHVRHGERSRALALRIELLDGRWQCVAVEFG